MLSIGLTGRTSEAISMRVRSSDTEIVYEVRGHGPDVVLLHPFPAHRGVWIPAARRLESRYRLILPDLRGHGESSAGEGPATMEKHAADIARVLDDAGIGKAVFAGESIGGYILFEFWRRYRERVSALVLCNTKAGADNAEARATRLRSAEDAEKRGVEPFIDSMIPKLLGESTRANRPDLVETARAMMMKMSAAGVAAVQRGMAERPDSVPTLATIDVPTLLVTGNEDSLTGPVEAEMMQRHIRGSAMRVIAKAGHYAVFERHQEAAEVMRQFLDSVSR
ncbi:MAG TPA: alpha/beta fold hydrolase [Terriglobales bacterium]|nr:alpha/beta fold hydrolase [Terriglobales bacterium]